MRPTPEQEAAAAREKILTRARSEAWPQSVDVSRALGSSNESGGRQRATRMRVAGELLGLWSPTEGTFYHPPFQLLPDGRVHPRVAELLAALAEIPTYHPNDDATGWGRIGWLLQPRLSLSERGIAEERSPDGIALNEDELDQTARAPADVFVADPESVIALARAEASEISEGR